MLVGAGSFAGAGGRFGITAVRNGFSAVLPKRINYAWLQSEQATPHHVINMWGKMRSGVFTTTILFRTARSKITTTHAGDHQEHAAISNSRCSGGWFSSQNDKRLPSAQLPG